MRTTIVIPTYNERENLRPLVERISAVTAHPLNLPLSRRFGRDGPAGRGEKMEYRVLIVDDNSPDGTGELADELAREGIPVQVLHRARKEGLGAAYVAGFERALQDGVDAIVQMDADGSHDPAEIPKMIALLSPMSWRAEAKQSRDVRTEVGIASVARLPRNDTRETDLVVGSRRVTGGQTIGWGPHRHLMSRGAQWVARAMLGFRIRDITSGFRAWRAEALRQVLSNSIHERVASGYAFQEEMLHRAEQLGLRIAEHPITFRDRERGRSKLGWRDVLGFFRTLWRLWIGSHDRRFAVWLGLSLIILTSLPYLYGWLRTPPGHVYTGVHALASGDMAVYASYIEQTRDGRWLFVDLFTSEWPQRPFLNVLWLPVGLLARITGLPTVLTFHLARVLLIIPFILFLARFVTTFLRKPIAGWPVRTIRHTALVFLAFSSGLGPLVADAILPLSNARWRTGYDFWPMDLWVPESNTFLTLFQSPHFIVSLWLLLYVILAALRFTETRAYRWSMTSGVAALILFQFHPFYVPTVATVLVVWAFIESVAVRRIRWDLIRHAAIVGIISASSALSHLWLVLNDPITIARANQNLLFTTDWWLVALSYGFLVPLAVIGIARLLRGRTIEGRLLLTWFVVTIVLIYSPLTWQRRLTEGLHVVIVLIAMIGLFPLLAWLRGLTPMWIRQYTWSLTTATIIAVPLLGVSTIVNLVRDFALYTIRFPQSIPRHSFYYPADAVDAMRWIRERASLGEATFAVGIDGHFLPMFAARQTVLGHGVETAHFVEKYQTSYALSGGRVAPAEARVFLTRERTHFILVTDASRGLWSIDPATIPGVTLAYRNSGAEVYEIR